MIKVWYPPTLASPPPCLLWNLIWISSPEDDSQPPWHLTQGERVSRYIIGFEYYKISTENANTLNSQQLNPQDTFHPSKLFFLINPVSSFSSRRAASFMIFINCQDIYVVILLRSVQCSTLWAGNRNTPWPLDNLFVFFLLTHLKFSWLCVEIKLNCCGLLKGCLF